MRRLFRYGAGLAGGKSKVRYGGKGWIAYQSR